MMQNVLICAAELSRQPSPLRTVKVEKCNWSFYQDHKDDVRILQICIYADSLPISVTTATYFPGFLQKTIKDISFR